MDYKGRLFFVIQRKFPAWLTLGLLLLSPLSPAAEKPVDAVVIMDSSGSMKQNDPRELRKPASKLFINLLHSNDRISVMSFSDNAYPITFLTQLDTDADIQRSLNATDKVSSRGIYTNIHAALARAMDILKDTDTDKHRPIIILMSDGHIDVGNAQKDAELRQQIIEQQIPALKARHIQVYSIAFTQNSDQELLQQIADGTDGRYALAATSDVLHKVFTKIFEQTKQPNMLPLTENKFMVDDSITEVTILTNKKNPDSKILLQDPSGKKITSTFKDKSIKWFVSSSFDMITLKHPARGEWKILLSDDDNKAYIVANIQLRTQFHFEKDSPTPRLLIEARFVKDDQTITNADLLSRMQMKLEIQSPDGKLETLEVPAANAEGIYRIQYTPEADGTYAATMLASSRTFQRQQVFSFRASLPEKPPAPKPVQAKPAAPVPAAKKPEEPAQPPKPEPAPEEGESVTHTIITFVLFNIVLLIIALNAFFIYRMRKNKKPPEQPADE